MSNLVKNETQSIFLTGATGVLGARILKDLLETTNDTIFCLVRAPTLLDGMVRVQSFLKIYGVDEALITELPTRIQVVLGDISSPNLGLSAEDHASLAARIDCTIHAAASTNLFLSYRRIEVINVLGVQNILDFVLGTEQKRLHYVSTFTVIGDKLYDPSVVFSEKDLEIGQAFEDLNYQRSKFVAEQMIRKAQSQGLRWNIYRPGQIFGDSQNGRYPSGQTNVSGLFLDIFKTVIETGIAFQSDGHFDITPVDYVSSAIVTLAFKRNVPFETYHLLNPYPKSYTEVIDLLRNEGYPIQPVLQSEYKTMLEDESMNYKSATTKAFKSWLSRSNFDFRVTAVFDSSLTVSLLKPYGVVCPPIDQTLMHTYIAHGIAQDYFPKPVKAE